MIIALKANYRKEPAKLQEGITRNVPTYVIKSNTYIQIESVLREIFKMPQEISEEDIAVSHAEEAIEEIMNDTSGGLNSLGACRRRTRSCAACSTRSPRTTR